MPPFVSSGFTTSSEIGSSPLGITTIVLGSTLPSRPALTAVTLTVADLGKTVKPTRSARGTVTAPSVLNRIPFWVLTTLPAGIVLDEVKSLFRNRTTPLAFASSTRLPVVGKVFVAVASTVTTSAGTTLASASGEVTLGSARIVIPTGPTLSFFGVTTIVADGSTR